MAKNVRIKVSHMENTPKIVSVNAQKSTMVTIAKMNIFAMKDQVSLTVNMEVY